MSLFWAPDWLFWHLKKVKVKKSRSSKHIKLQNNIKLRTSRTYFLMFMKSKIKDYKVLLYKVSVLHPEDSLAAAMSHQLVTEVLRPVGPLVGPVAIPGEATPGVPQPQQPAAEWQVDDMIKKGMTKTGFRQNSGCNLKNEEYNKCLRENTFLKKIYIQKKEQMVLCNQTAFHSSGCLKGDNVSSSLPLRLLCGSKLKWSCVTLG